MLFVFGWFGHCLSDDDDVCHKGMEGVTTTRVYPATRAETAPSASRDKEGRSATKPLRTVGTVCSSEELGECPGASLLQGARPRAGVSGCAPSCAHPPGGRAIGPAPGPARKERGPHVQGRRVSKTTCRGCVAQEYKSQVLVPIAVLDNLFFQSTG